MRSYHGCPQAGIGSSAVVRKPQGSPGQGQGMPSELGRPQRGGPATAPGSTAAAAAAVQSCPWRKLAAGLLQRHFCSWEVNCCCITDR